MIIIRPYVFLNIIYLSLELFINNKLADSDSVKYLTTVKMLCY
jgi:hypothetical protein